jgi:hypothetical protein
MVDALLPALPNQFYKMTVTSKKPALKKTLICKRPQLTIGATV